MKILVDILQPTHNIIILCYYFETECHFFTLYCGKFNKALNAI